MRFCQRQVCRRQWRRWDGRERRRALLRGAGSDDGVYAWNRHVVVAVVVSLPVNYLKLNRELTVLQSIFKLVTTLDPQEALQESSVWLALYQSPWKRQGLQLATTRHFGAKTTINW